MPTNNMQKRAPAGLPEGISVRSAIVRPTTLRDVDRSVEFTISTEEPALVWDWSRWDVVREVLLQSGLEVPANKQVPFLDSHNRSSVQNVLGSMREFRTENNETVARAYFSKKEIAKNAFEDVKDGHITDTSVGYEVVDSVWIPDGEKLVHEGREYAGPLRLSKRWRLGENSLVAIGADAGAKVRSEPVTEPPATPTSFPVNPSASRAEQISGGSFRMNTRLYQLLISRGLAQGSTDEEALAFLGSLSEKDQAALRSQAAQPDHAGAPAVNVEAIREEARKAEQERTQSILKACSVPGCEDMASAMIANGTSADAARAAVIERLAKNSQSMSAPRVDVVADERDKFRAAAEQGVMARAGIAVEKPVAGHERFRGMSLIRMAEECLRIAGRPDHTGDPSQIAIRAMSTTDFPLILAASANKIMQKAYGQAPETWPAICEIGEGRDFKAMTRPQFSESPAFTLVKENGEYNEVAFSEFAPSLTIQTYGARVNLTRQMVINDDLGAFLRIPMMFGLAAQRKIGDLVYALITGNVAINSSSKGSLTLFHADHANLMNPVLPLGVDALSEMRRMLRVQTGLKGAILNLGLKTLLVPAALETVAELLIMSPNYPQIGAGPILNPFANKAAVVAEPRLDANSLTAFYGVADPAQVGTIEVAFLNGVRNPVIQDGESGNPDVRTFWARIDAGVGLKDHRGMVKSAGK